MFTGTCARLTRADFVADLGVERICGCLPIPGSVSCPMYFSSIGCPDSDSSSEMMMRLARACEIATSGVLCRTSLSTGRWRFSILGNWEARTLTNFAVAVKIYHLYFLGCFSLYRRWRETLADLESSRNRRVQWTTKVDRGLRIWMFHVIQRTPIYTRSVMSPFVGKRDAGSHSAIHRGR